MDSNSKRIAKNTLYLYMRMGVLMLISIFTSRVLLDKLGVGDFGIYNVVGGVTVLFAFFSSSLTNASQRFITIELGRNDIIKANNVFNQHLILYFLIAAGVLLLAETFGLWFVYTQLNFPADRTYAAVCVYHFTVVSLCLTLLGIVFNSCIVAHEAMDVFAFLGIFEGIAKLVVAYLLSIATVDRLILYGFLMFMITFIVQSFYMIYCFKRYQECKLRWRWDKDILKKTSSVVGWNMMGTAVYAINDSGVNILMNLFFGPIVNAARAISYQVSGAVGNFSSNFFTSVRPQLMKSYASGDYDYMMKLFYNSSKYSYYLLWIICLPIMFSSSELLAIWLVDVPDHADIFTIWILIYSLIGTLNNPIWTVALAVGKLKWYILIGSGIFLLVFPFSYIALKLGYPPVSVFIVMVVVRIIYLYAVLRIIKVYIPITCSGYLIKIVWPIVKSMFVSTIIAALVYHFMPASAFGTIFYCVIVCLTTIVCVAIVGVTASERAIVFEYIRNKICKR